MDGWINYRTAKPVGFDRSGPPAIPISSRISLPSRESQELLDQAVECRANPYLGADLETFIQAARHAGRAALSAGTRAEADRILHDGSGAVLFDNLPVDPVPAPTPATGGALDPAHKSTFVTEFVAVALGTVVDAEIYNFRQEGRGTAPLFDNVVPVESLKFQRGAGGYANNFPFHCDSTWHRMRPDYVALTGVRADPNALTMVSSVQGIAGSELAARMPTESFRLKPPDLYTEMEQQGIPLGTPYHRMLDPVETAGTGGLSVNFNGTDCRGPAAVEWLASLEDLVESNATHCVLGPGNAVLLNNRRVCHTRTGYHPTFGPRARWFVRTNFRRDLWNRSAADSPAQDVTALTAHGWMSPDGRLTKAFLPFVTQPWRVAELTGPSRTLAAKALHHTPVPGSRIV